MSKDLKPNADGYYRKTFTVTGIDGQKHDIRLRDRDIDKFREKCLRLQIDIERGELSVSNNTKFSKWAEDWLEAYKKDSVCAKSYATYEANIANHINPQIGEMKLKDIKQIHCRKVLNTQKGKSFSHISKIRMTLYQIFEAAIDSELMNKNPARSLTLPDCTEGTHRSITDEERKYILALADTHRAGLWVLTMLYCGLRPSEAIALNWGDIDFKNGLITVSHSMYNTKKTKTESGARCVPAPPALIRKLKEEKRQAAATFVFHQHKDKLKPHTPTSMRSMWDNFKRELDISMGAELKRNKIIKSVVAKDLTPYCLRHTYATDLQLANIPLNVAKVLLGHKDVATTGNIYTHYTADTQAQTVKTLTAFWTAKPKKKTTALAKFAASP